jgi:hypothetical protein
MTGFASIPDILSSTGVVDRVRFDPVHEASRHPMSRSPPPCNHVGCFRASPTEPKIDATNSAQAIRRHSLLFQILSHGQ